MLKKTLLSLCVLCIVAVKVSGQNVFQLTQYFFDPLSFNPAVAGSDQGFAASAILRKQWVGFEGGPSTGALSAHLPIPRLKSGAGVSFKYDQIGNFTFTSFSPAFSYKYRNGLIVLHLGIAPVLYSGSVKNDWLSHVPVTEDPAIPDNGTRNSTIDVNLGLFYKAGKYFAGLSVVNLVGQRVKRVNMELSRTMFLNAGYQFKIPGSQSIDWTAGFAYRTDMSNTAGSQKDLNLVGLFRDSFWLGVNYRFSDSFSPLIGFQKYIPAGKIRIGYAYDYTISALSNHTSGSHEIAIYFVNFSDKPRENEKYKNVRFL